MSNPAHTPQFTFLISFSWNNLGLPVIQDKLALGSEVLIKVLVPFVGKSLSTLTIMRPSDTSQATFGSPSTTRSYPSLFSSNSIGNTAEAGSSSTGWQIGSPCPRWAL